ncbi:carboxypeptidase regulatory-like domain-containing protein [bacterium]|nr:carboxypeptidase regulatory-like domain-containing protein [bacterium]
MRKVMLILMYFLLLVWSLSAVEYIEIGNGTSTTDCVPVRASSDYGWSKYILTSDQLGEANEIYGIDFYVGNNPENYTINNQYLYLKHTSANVVEDYYHYESVTEFSLVFQGSITWNGSGWQGVEFDRIFSYDGTSNLQILWLNYNGYHVAGQPNFLKTDSQTINSSYRYDNYYFPSGTGTSVSYYPNTRLYVIPDGSASFPEIERPLNNSINVELETDLMWNVGDNTEFVNVYFSENKTEVDNNSPSALVYDGQVICSLSVSLDYAKRYYWKVVASNSTTDFFAETDVHTFLARLEFPGLGTRESPYLIDDIDDLIFISNFHQIWDKHFLQTSDIDASSTTTLNDGAGFTPIGNSLTYFTGTYNGQGYTISELYINQNTSYIGMFKIAKYASILNLGLDNVNIHGWQSVGAIAGYVEDSNISNCFVTGSFISSTNIVGGLFGEAQGSNISSCYTDSAVSGEGNVGGLIGLARQNLNVNNNYVTGPVTGNNNVGGLIGFVYYNVQISNCYATGAVTGNSYVGGLIGKDLAGNLTIEGSFWDILTTGQTESAGGIGRTTAQMKNIDTYLNAGWDFEDIWFIHSEMNSGYPVFHSTAIKNNQIVNNANHISLTPTISFEVNSIYQNYELYFGSTPNPETALIPYGSVTNPITYTFTEALEYLTDYYWTVILYDINSDVTTFNYTFKTRPVLDGLGTEESPYLINDLSNLITLSDDFYYWDKFLTQTAHIDASETSNLNNGFGFIPIGTESINFSGTYDGQGYTISNLYIDRVYDDYGGLFGYAQSASFSNISIIRAEIHGIGLIGSLLGAGYQSSFTNCYAMANVNGYSKVGGLVGEIYSSIFEQCYATGTVNALPGTAAGGLIGFASNTMVNNSFSTGTVSAYYGYCGGLIGYIHYSTVNNCYSTGTVTGPSNVGGLIGYDAYNESNFTNSFWDMESSQVLVSVGGNGKTSQEMKSLSTYLNAGWDFVEEEINGTEDIWSIRTWLNSGYPSFADEIIMPGFLPNHAVNIYPLDGIDRMASSDYLHWQDDDLELTTGYKLSLGTDNPPTNLVNKEDLGLALSYNYSNLIPNTSYYWQVTPYNMSGDTPDCPVWSFTTGSAGVVSIGNGNNTSAPLPIHNDMRRSYSQTIYYQSELNLSNRQIEKLSFYLTDSFNITGANQWRVYLGHTDKSEFSGNNDWLLSDQGLIQVADVTLNTSLNTGWVEIELDTPFVYNNIDNLIVGVIEYSSTIPIYHDFYTVETENNRSLSFGHDTINPNPNIAYLGQLLTSIPKINFTFSEPLTTFAGIVRNSINSPLNGANIVISGLGSITSDELGEFSVNDIDAGTYLLTISAPWYETKNIDYEVIQGENNYLEITLLEELLPASNVTASLAVDLNNVEVTWTEPTLARGAIDGKKVGKSNTSEKAILAHKQAPEERTNQPAVYYNLYRYMEGEENSPDNWIEVATNMNTLVYIDTSFPSLELNTYYWAVEAIYPNNRLAQPTMSNAIVKQAHIESNIGEEINFGTIYYTNASGFEEIIISNTGTATLVINDISCDETAYNLVYDEADFFIEPNSTMTIQVNFDPDNTGIFVSDLVVNNNSANEPSFSITLRGLCQYVPPADPEGVQVSMINNTAQITWNPVIEDVNENPITPDLYIVYYNARNTQNEDDFYYHGSTSELNYSHHNVGVFSQFMFYRVKAYVDVDDVILNQINELVSQKRNISMKEIENLRLKSKEKK